MTGVELRLRKQAKRPPLDFVPTAVVRDCACPTLSFAVELSDEHITDRVPNARTKTKVVGGHRVCAELHAHTQAILRDRARYTFCLNWYTTQRPALQQRRAAAAALSESVSGRGRWSRRTVHLRTSCRLALSFHRNPDSLFPRELHKECAVAGR